MGNEIFSSYLDMVVLKDEVFDVTYFMDLDAKVICKEELFEVEHGLGEEIRWTLFDHPSD